jgi:hypothetical protein
MGLNKRAVRKSGAEPTQRKLDVFFDGFLKTGVFVVHIVLRCDLNDLLEAVRSGDLEADARVRAIGMWLIAARGGSRFSCVDCGRNFGAEAEPVGFAVSTRFADPRQSISAGICAHCLVDNDDLLDMALLRALEIWTDVHAVNSGAA